MYCYWNFTAEYITKENIIARNNSSYKFTVRIITNNTSITWNSRDTHDWNDINFELRLFCEFEEELTQFSLGIVIQNAPLN